MRINWIAQILSITMNCNSFLCSKTCLESTSWVFRAQPMDFFWGLEVDTWRFLQPWEMDGGMVFSSARSVGALQIWWVKNLKKNKTYILTQQWYEEAIPWAKDDLWKKNSLGSWVQYIYINDYKCMYGCWKKTKRYLFHPDFFARMMSCPKETWNLIGFSTTQISTRVFSALFPGAGWHWGGTLRCAW